MGTISRRHLWLVIAIIAISAASPLTLYWLVVGRAPAVSCSEAQRLLDDNNAVLVDLGLPPHPTIAGLPHAIRWPLPSILQTRTPNDIPLELRSRKLLLLCPGGIRSAQAALHLRQIGVDDVFSVRGGLQEWIAVAPGCPTGIRFRSDPVRPAPIPAFRPSPAHEQWAVVLTFFGVKALYSLLAAAIALVLWRRTEPDLSALRFAMIFFFIGEAFCFINVMVFFEHSFLLEHLHSVGMVLAFAYSTYALLAGLDRHLIHYSDDTRCAATGLCRVCIKHAPVPCGLRRLFMVLIPATALIAAIPLFASLRDLAYNTRILGILHSYRHPIIHQLYELRYLPILSMTLLAACLLVLIRERHPVSLSKILFSAAVGAAGFSLFRLFLVASFIDNQVWFAAWEETTELLYIATAAAILLIFPRTLLGSEK
ncbi:MAG: rhodanese-like domain-containing protein [Bacillota bacterium]